MPKKTLKKGKILQCFPRGCLEKRYIFTKIGALKVPFLASPLLMFSVFSPIYGSVKQFFELHNKNKRACFYICNLKKPCDFKMRRTLYCSAVCADTVFQDVGKRHLYILWCVVIFEVIW